MALMLVLGVAAAAAYVATLMWWKAPVASAQQATSSDASFVVRCDFSHRKHDDPTNLAIKCATYRRSNGGRKSYLYDAPDNS